MGKGENAGRPTKQNGTPRRLCLGISPVYLVAEQKYRVLPK